MKTSTKLISTAIASVAGLALAGGAAVAATSSLAVADAPGQVLKVSGVGAAAAHANATAIENADEQARGLFGTDASTEADAGVTVEEGTESAEVATPVEPWEAAENASTVKGSETGESVSAWAHTNVDVETVAPGAAISLDASTKASATGR